VKKENIIPYKKFKGFLSNGFLIPQPFVHSGLKFKDKFQKENFKKLICSAEVCCIIFFMIRNVIQHKSLKTIMIYTYVLIRGIGTKSPLD
jgi:hypothetical protein